MRVLSALIGLGSITLLALPTLTLAADPPASGVTKVSVVGVDIQGGRLGLNFPAPIGQRGLPVDDAAAKTKLWQVQVGDAVEIEVDALANPQHVKRLVTISRPVNQGGRLAALAVGLLIVLVAAHIWSRSANKTLRDFVVGLDGRYSNSKCQFALWFGTAIMVYLATVVLRVYTWGPDFLYGVGFPANLLALTGLSVLTFGGAKAITTTKVDNSVRNAPAMAAAANRATAEAIAAAGAALPPAAPQAVVDAHNVVVNATAQAAQSVAAQAAVAPAPKPAPGNGSNLLADLVQNDRGDLDIGDFQMIFITLLAAITFVITGYNFLGAIAQDAHVMLPDVDTTLLSVFGLGQGAYLIKKIASKPGEG